MRKLIKQCLLSQPTLTEISQSKDCVNHCESQDHASPTVKPAAILLPLIERSAGIQVILTQRTEHLHHHGGQICFPGGMADSQDLDSIATALRETEEEIGLQRSYIEIIGFLENLKTTSGFLITPVVGFVNLGFELVIDRFEVAEVFEVPLEFIMNSENHQQYQVFYQGQLRSFYAFAYQKRFIWGATAAILMNLYQRYERIV